MSSREPRTIRLPLEAYPTMNPFALDLVKGRGSASKFCERRSFESMTPSGVVRDGDLVEALVRSNAAWGNDVAEDVRAWSTGKTLTLIAGQQVGLGGGPLYTLAKIASLIELKRRFAAAGTPATALFWLATEDHDFDEIARIDLLSHGEVETIRMSDPMSRRLVVGSREIPENLRRDLCRILEIDPSSDWLAPSITFGDSFARLIARVAPSELVLVDSLLPELRKAGVPLFAGLIESWSDLEGEISRRSEAIESAGYRRQVAPVEDGRYRLLWLVGSRGERQPIVRDGNEWLAGSESVDLMQIARERPETISTGALTRPLLQDYVLAPDVFVGGPAEVAYYAQISGLHDRLGVRCPHVALRGHALVAPEKYLRALDRYRVDPVEAFDPVDEVILRHEADRLAELERIIEAMARGLESGIAEVKDAVLDSDRSLEKSVARTARRINHQVSKLSERGRRAIARRDRERHKAITRLCSMLNPGGVAQDRVIGWISFWQTYGTWFVDRLVDGVRTDADTFSIVGL